MLTVGFRRIFLTAGVTALVAIGLGASPAGASPTPTSGVTCDNKGVCLVEADAPSSSGSAAKGATRDKAKNGETKKASAGKKSCTIGDVEVPCKSRDGKWSQSDGCYWDLQDPQDPPPAGKTSSDGAWYVCTLADVETANLPAADVQAQGAPVWRSTPPKGVTKLSPGQAAAKLVKQMQFKPVAIGASTDVYGSDRWYVGMPLWLWVKNKSDVQVMGPYSKSATIGGTTVSAKAELSSITYAMGDGGKVVCGDGGGTVFQKSRIHQFSPSKCDYEYSKMSANNGKGSYTITATSEWSVRWSADGQTGVIPMQVQSTKSIRVGEIQALNVQ